MGQSRRERTWAKPRSTRHVWVRLAERHPYEPPRQGLVVSWRRRSYEWEALVVLVEDAMSEPIVVLRWLPAKSLRPVSTDPNRVFGLR